MTATPGIRLTRRHAITTLASAPIALTLLARSSPTFAHDDHGSTPGASPEASSEASSGASPNAALASLPAYATFTVKASDTGFEIPAEVPAGRVLVTFENPSAVGVGLFFWTLDGMTIAELAQALPPREPGSIGAASDVFYTADQPGAPGYAEPGGSSQAVIDLPPGDYAVLTEEGAWPTPFTAVAQGGADATPEILPEPVADADVQLLDFAFVGIPTEVKAGPAIWKVTNGAAEPHQLIVGKIPDGMTLDEVLEGFIPPANGTPDPKRMTREQFYAVGGIEIMSPGHSAWAIFDHEPGTHAAVCLVPDKTGMLHVQMGMAAVFEVTA